MSIYVYIHMGACKGHKGKSDSLRWGYMWLWAPNRGAGNQLQSSTRAAHTPNCCVDISLASLYYYFSNSKNLVVHTGL